MSYVPLLVYIHILLMVFWLGTDIGVYLAGLRFMNPKLSIAERNAVIQLGIVIDRYPRVCFVAMIPVGLQLSFSLGSMPISARMMGLTWIASSIWMICVIAGIRLSGTTRAHPWKLLERGFLAAGLILFTATGVAGWTGRMLIPNWLSGKLVSYGAICLFAILLERAFAPVFGAFGAIVAGGSTPEREALLRRHMKQTYVWVLAIYAGVLLCGYLGTVKP